MLFDDPEKEEYVQENYLANNYYYQKRANLDPERCKLNLERAIRRRQRESQVVIACSHAPKDWCQIRSIPFEELEDFHDRYWDCVGTVSKRVFVADNLSVEPVHSPKKDLNITCHIQKSDGTLVWVCQKSFISVLGVSKHKILAIGKAKLMNGAQLHKETRGGKRWKGMNTKGDGSKKETENGWFDDSFDSESATSSKRMKMDDSYEGSINSETEIYPNVEFDGVQNENDDEDDDRDIFEPEVEMTESQENGESGDEIDIFQPEVEITETPPVNRLGAGFDPPKPNEEEDDDDDDDEPGQIIPGAGWLKKPTRRPINKRPIQNKLHMPLQQGQSLAQKQQQITAARQQQQQLIAIRQKQQQFAMQQQQQRFQHQQRQGSSQQPFEISNFVECQMVGEENTNSNSSTMLKRPFMGPENWKRTIERSIRRQQREKDVSINCTHAMTRFCKIQRISMQDLVNFHNAYWRCNGIVEERIFLARWLIVQPKNHRREMSICHRIPCRDGSIYEVCQKSFLSVVGITKHKVQAAARAKLRGELYKKDGRGGNNNRPQKLHSNSSPNFQISNVVGNYNPRQPSQPEEIEIKNEPTIEINDSEDDGGAADDENEIIQSFSEDAADIDEKYKKILKRLKCELEFYKKRNRRLSTDRKILFNRIARSSSRKLKGTEKYNGKKCSTSSEANNFSKKESIGKIKSKENNELKTSANHMKNGIENRDLEGTEIEKCKIKINHNKLIENNESFSNKITHCNEIAENNSIVFQNNDSNNDEETNVLTNFEIKSEIEGNVEQINDN